MNSLTLVVTVITCITTILSITFAILAFARTKSKDDENESVKLESRLISMEKDILYIRESLDNLKTWQLEYDKRLYNLEKRIIK